MSKGNMYRIEPSPRSDRDLIKLIQATCFGQLYVHYLKRVPFIRQFVQHAWRVVYPLYVSFYPKRNLKKLPLIRLSRVMSQDNTWVLHETETVITPHPVVFPAIEASELKSPHSKYSFPKLSVTVIHKAEITGGTNFVRTSSKYVCHDLYDFTKDYTSEELHGRNVIRYKKKKACWQIDDPRPEVISEAASFVDSLATNYAHWITEILPRVALFCSDERFRNIPIIVNDGLHKNIMESLFAVTGSGRRVVVLPLGRILKVQSLYAVSPTGYVPFEPRKRFLDNRSHGLFSRYAFEILNRSLGADEESASKTNPCKRKIYLRRNSTGRNIANTKDLERMLIKHGYEVIDPEKLTFREQVALFTQADSVIGASGAAMANMVFCAPGTNIVILIPKYKDTIYWYWQNIACSSGNQIKYVLGKPIHNSSYNGIHSDFRVHISEVERAINYH